MDRLAFVMLVLSLAACGPAPGYNADGQFMGDPNAGLASPRRAPPPQQTSGGQAQPQQAPVYDPAAQQSGQPATSAPPQQGSCDNSCRFANNGECDDGREGSDTDVCSPGTDCSDCGS
jgi:hypothetical protein